MTALAYSVSDSRVMLRRNLKHQLRYPSMTLMLIGIPIVLLLLFVYVFGGQLGTGLGAHQGRSAYLNFVVPGSCSSPLLRRSRARRSWSPWT